MDDDQLRRKAMRELQRDPQLFVNMLDDTTKAKLFHCLTWNDLLNLISTLDLNAPRRADIERLLIAQRQLDWYTVDGMDIRNATAEQLAEMLRKINFHGLLSATQRIPAIKHHMVRWMARLAEERSSGLSEV
jgi:hypothetical protein